MRSNLHRTIALAFVCLVGCGTHLSDPYDPEGDDWDGDASVALDAEPLPEAPDEEPDPELDLLPPEPEEPAEYEPPDEADVEEPVADGLGGSATHRVVRTTHRVMHWNIAGGKEHDCRTEQITRAVVRFIRDRRAQFISLNEICETQYHAIRRVLAQRWGKDRRFSAYAANNRRVGVAIFSRYDLTDITQMRLGRDRYGLRHMVCGRVRFRPHLRFCSTHLSPSRSLARPQLNLVQDRIERWWNNQRDTVILAGDFNLESNSQAFDDIYVREANHPRHNPDNRGHYHELDDADRANCLGYGENTGLRRTGGACGNGRRIDHIFIRANRIVDDRYGSDARNIPTDCSGRCSDHRPVFGWARVRVRVDL